MSRKAIECLNLIKRFAPRPKRPRSPSSDPAGSALAAVDGVNLAVESQTTMAIVGPSGCGKTTLLRLIAGFEHPDSGTVDIGTRRVVGPGLWLPPESRRVGMVFQDYALFPHLTVARNIAYGLPRGGSRSARIDEMLDLVGLTGMADRMPHQLSGGEQQRVALARALAPQPDVLLLDEPFSNLDATRRVSIRSEVREILKRAGTTAIFVTHDQEEAFFLGDRVAVMNRGRIEQSGTPEAVFHQPASRFVASFLGIADFLPGRIENGSVRTLLGDVPVPDNAGDATSVDVMIRPDDIQIVPCETAPSGRGTVCDRQFRGTHYVYQIELADGNRLHVMASHTVRHELGTSVQLSVVPGHDLTLFPAVDPS